MNLYFLSIIIIYFLYGSLSFNFFSAAKQWAFFLLNAAIQQVRNFNSHWIVQLIISVSLLASIQTSWAIIKDKSVGSLTPLPSLSLLVNCLIWCGYGWLKRDLTVFLPNATGVLVGAWCTHVYNQFCFQILTSFYIGSGMILLVALFALITDSADLLGTIGCVLSVVLMGSPLAALQSVCRERSTASLPFGFSAAVWCNSFCWFCYGYLVAFDPMVTYCCIC